MPRGRLRAVPQLALDEQVVEAPELEAILERRIRAKDDVSEVRKVYEGVDVEAKAAIEKLEIAEDQAIRIGRFRIVKASVAAKSVSFETKASSRLRITLVEEA